MQEPHSKHTASSRPPDPRDFRIIDSSKIDLRVMAQYDNLVEGQQNKQDLESSTFNVRMSQKGSPARMKKAELLQYAREIRTVLRSWEREEWVSAISPEDKTKFTIVNFTKTPDGWDGLALHQGRFKASEKIFVSRIDDFGLTIKPLSSKKSLVSLIMQGLSLEQVAESLVNLAKERNLPFKKLDIPEALKAKADVSEPPSVDGKIDKDLLEDFIVPVQSPSCYLRELGTRKPDSRKRSYSVVPVCKEYTKERGEGGWLINTKDTATRTLAALSLKGPGRWLANKVGIFKQPEYFSTYISSSAYGEPRVFSCWTFKDYAKAFPVDLLFTQLEAFSDEYDELRYHVPGFDLVLRAGELDIKKGYDSEFFLEDEISSKVLKSIASCDSASDKLATFISELSEINESFTTSGPTEESLVFKTDFISRVTEHKKVLYLKPMDKAQGMGIIKVRPLDDGTFCIESNCERTCESLRLFKAGFGHFIKDIPQYVKKALRPWIEFLRRPLSVKDTKGDYTSRILNAEELATFLSEKISGNWIAEEEIPIERIDGARIEFRFYFTPEATNGRYILSGHNAKASSAKVAGNISTFGYGLETFKTIRQLITQRSPELQEEELDKATNEMAQKLFNEAELFLEHFLNSAGRLKSMTLGAKESFEHLNASMGLDIAPVWSEELKSFEWYLVELNACSGDTTRPGTHALESTDPYRGVFVRDRSFLRRELISP